MGFQICLGCPPLPGFGGIERSWISEHIYTTITHMSRNVLFAVSLVVASFLASESRAETTPVVFHAHHQSEELRLFGVGPRGDLLASELHLLGKLMRCRRTDEAHDIHPRLARHLALISRHFRQPVVIVSGYRAKARRGHRRSYHLRGQAADIYVKGVPPVEVRDLAVERRIGGIGFYPNSGFVHVDVRPRRFWWVDYSRPGQLDRLIPDPLGDAPEGPRASEAPAKHGAVQGDTHHHHHHAAEVSPGPAKLGCS